MPEENVTVMVIEALDHFTTLETNHMKESQAIIRYVGILVEENENYIVLEGHRADLEDNDSNITAYHVMKKAIKKMGTAEITLVEVKE